MKKYLALLLAVMMLVGLVPMTTSAAESEDPNYGTIVYGSSTEISGDWGRAMWTNNATDALIRELINAYGTVMSNKDAEYVVNEAVVEALETQETEEGTKIFTITIKSDLTYNNGDPITAKDFVTEALFVCSQEAVDLGATMSTAFTTFVGGEAYRNGEADTLAGVHLLDDYTFSMEIVADKLPYYFDITYAGASPMHYKLWFGEDVDVLDDGEGVYFNEAFTLDNITENVETQRYYSDNRVSAGPYTLQSYDDSAKEAILVKNELFAGDIYGNVPEIEKIVIIRAEEATWADAMRTNVFNFYDTITSGTDINVAMDIMDEMGLHDFTVFDRAGYGYLNFQCDFGPTQFQEVRHAIGHLLDRPEFAETFCQGWGGLVHGPYGQAHWMFKEAEEWIEDNLNKYPASYEMAIASLEKGGWVLNENGDDYVEGEGVRYKEVTDEEAGEYEYVVELDDGRKLMALEIEWLSTENNEVSELLKVMLSETDNTKNAGIKINRTEVNFTELLNWYYRDDSAGEEYGVPKYGLFNLATNFTPAYDQSYYFSLDPDFASYNSSKIYNERLDELSMDMVYGIEAGDSETYLEIWKEFVQLWNEELPVLPLYSNTYITMFPVWLENYEQNSFWDFEQAIVGATIK